MSATTSGKPGLAVPVAPGRDHIRGPVDAPTTLVEYGDYECTYCAAAHSIVNAIQIRMGTRLRYVFRHFPMTSVHPHAQPAAEAAEAADAQKRFWVMHEVLFENQRRLADAQLEAYAAAIGLDLKSFTHDLRTHVNVPRIRADFMSGVKSGAQGTPAFYINGVRHDGSWDLSSLIAAIDRSTAALARAARRALPAERSSVT